MPFWGWCVDKSIRYKNNSDRTFYKLKTGKSVLMRILFWNTNGNVNINIYIANLVRDNKIDILAVAEYNANKRELLNLLAQHDITFIENYTEGCSRIDLWSNFVNIKPGVQEKHYSLHVLNDDCVLCCLHLMSDLHGDHGDERFEIIKDAIYEIKKLEAAINTDKTVIIGDFNEMPYDKGCLNANGFHGLPALTENDKSIRTVNAKEYRKFYNPMWNLFGDYSYPPGTYYYNKAVLHSPMWFMFDQVIISKGLIPLFKKESLKIITSCSYSNLMDAKMHPDKHISDHFPIMCEIDN